MAEIVSETSSTTDPGAKTSYKPSSFFFERLWAGIFHAGIFFSWYLLVSFENELQRDWFAVSFAPKKQ